MIGAAIGPDILYFQGLVTRVLRLAILISLELLLRRIPYFCTCVFLAHRCAKLAHRCANFFTFQSRH